MNDQLKYLYEKYQLKNIEELEEKFIELATIYDMNRRFKKINTLEEIANLLLLVPMGRLLIAKALIILVGEASGIDKNAIIAQKGSWKKLNQIEDMTLPPNELFLQDSSQLPNSECLNFCHENNIRLYIPLYNQDQLFGAVFLGNKLNKKPVTESEITFLRTIFEMNSAELYNIIAIQQLRESNKKLDNHLQLLNTIFETTQGFSFNLDEDSIIRLFTFTLMGRLTINKLYLCMIQNDSSHVLFSRGIKINNQINSLLTQEVCKFKSSKIIYLDENFRPTEEEPMYLVLNNVKDQKPTSFVIIGKKLNGEPFYDYEMEFIRTLLAQTITSLQNLELLHEKIEKERIEQELNVAKNIQKNLLPHELPAIPELEMCAYNEPSKEVGGDYYDIIKIDEDLYITIADVSGKSVPASLLMSNLQAALQVLVHQKLPLTEIVKRLNSLIFSNTASDKYITFFIGKLNLKSFEFEYINAGHNPPYLIDIGEKTLMPLELGGIILGMFPDFPFEQGQTELEKNQAIFLYTDGVNETVNEKDEEWGDENLKEFIQANAGLNPELFKSELIKTLDTFKGPRVENYDDITFIFIKR